MKIIIVNHQYGKCSVRNNCDFVPRVGDHIDIFYDPPPVVTKVIAYPGKRRLDLLDSYHPDIIALVVVE